MLDSFHNFHYNREEMLEEDIRDILKTAVLAAGITMSPSDAEGAAPRGIRNNNPGNIKHGDTWKGEIKSTDKIFYTTGRLTSEMVIKTVKMGVPILISRSGFTSWGVELAKKTNLTLIGRAKGKRYITLSGLDRIKY